VLASVVMAVVGAALVVAEEAAWVALQLRSWHSLPCALLSVFCEALVAFRDLKHHCPGDLVAHFIRERARLLCASAPVGRIVYAE